VAELAHRRAALDRAVAGPELRVYGLIKKTAPLDALEGLTLETLLLAVVAAPVLLGWDLSGRSALAGAPTSLWAWLLLAGPLTAVPLLLFGHGARRIP
jgi:chloramphenicol-sensitive protein RarD